MNKKAVVVSIVVVGVGLAVLAYVIMDSTNKVTQTAAQSTQSLSGLNALAGQASTLLSELGVKAST